MGWEHSELWSWCFLQRKAAHPPEMSWVPTHSAENSTVITSKPWSAWVADDYTVQIVRTTEPWRHLTDHTMSFISKIFLNPHTRGTALLKAMTYSKYLCISESLFFKPLSYLYTVPSLRKELLQSFAPSFLNCTRRTSTTITLQVLGIKQAAYINFSDTRLLG